MMRFAAVASFFRGKIEMQKNQRVFSTRLLGVGMLMLAQCGQAAVSWSAANTASANLFEGGFENGKALAVCRIELNGGIHIGKLLPNGECHVGWGGGEESQPAQSVLARNARLEWRPYDPRYQRQYGWLQNGGYEAASAATANSLASQQEQYVCRMLHQRGVHVGKLLAGTHECLIGYGGQEINSKNFDILVEKTAPAYTASLPPLDFASSAPIVKPTVKPIRDFPPYSSSIVPCVNGQPNIQSVSPTFSEGSVVVLTGACLSGSKKNGKLIFHFKGASAPKGGYSFLQSHALAWTDSRVEMKMLSFIANEKSAPIRIELITGEGKSASTTSHFVKNK